MASTKKPIISKESIDKLNELKTIDELYREYDQDVRKEQQISDNDKNSFINNIINNGEHFISESEILKAQRLEQKKYYIDYILNKTKKYGKYDDLFMYENEELYSIIEILNKQKTSIFRKIIKLLNL